MGIRKLTNAYMSTLCLEMSMLLHAGISIQYGVEMMIDDEPDRDGKQVLQALLKGLEEESTLAGAMTASKYFPPYLINMVDIGEQAGRLTETLKALAEHYERQDRLAVSIKNATLYPAVLLGMMIVVVLILIVQVLPIFNDVFGRMGAQMSPFAIQLMNFGTWFRGASVVIAGIFAFLFLVGFLAWAIPSVREGLIKAFKDRWGSKGVFGRIASSQFVSSMALAISSGLNIDDSVNLAASLNSDSKALNVKYKECMSLIESGTSLTEALKQTGILSAKDGRMLALGDRSGMSDSAMEEIARRSDRSVQDEIASIVGRIEPTLVIMTSVIVGIILLSVMLPLVGIMTSIG